MKVIATGDLHLDHGRWGATNPLTGRNTAWESAAGCWQAICNHAIDHRADLVVIAGDLFLNGRPSAEALELVADGLRQLSRALVPVVVVRGNHELAQVRPGHRGPLHRYSDLPGVVVVEDPDVVQLPSGLQVVALPWPRRSEVLSRLDATRTDADNADDLIARWVIGEVDRLCQTRLTAGHGPVLGVAHAAIGEATLRGSEQALWGVFSEPLIPLEALSRGPLDHVIVGHIHRRQRLDDRVHYVGSPDRIDFSEEHETKAFTELRIDPAGRIDIYDCPTPARTLTTIDATGDPEAARSAATQVPDGSLVRLLVPADQRSLEGDIADALNPAAQLVKTQVAPAVASPPALAPNVPEDIDVLEGLRRWLEARGEAPDRIRHLLEAASQLDDLSRTA